MSKFNNDPLYNENKFLVAKSEHIKDTLNAEELTKLSEIMYKVYEKHPNKYLVVNQDESYIDKVWDLIKENEKKEIIAFIGRAGSGKDYQCNLLKEKGYGHLAFADSLREIAFHSLGISQIDGEKYYTYLKENNIVKVQLTPTHEINFNFRTYLETLGTQGIRKYDNDFWCRCLIKKLKEGNYKKVCISDMRFINEYNYLKEYSEQNNYEFKVIFCNYRSDRYQDNNQHESALMGNYFATHGYANLEIIKDYQMKEYEKYIENIEEEKCQK